MLVMPFRLGCMGIKIERTVIVNLKQKLSVQVLSTYIVIGIGF